MLVSPAFFLFGGASTVTISIVLPINERFGLSGMYIKSLYIQKGQGCILRF